MDAAPPSAPSQTSQGNADFESLRRNAVQNFDAIVTPYIFGTVSIDVYSLRDPDTLLDETALQASHGEMPWHPYWGKFWDAAMGLATILASRDLTGINVMDLGCGLGVTGAIAAARGARVVLADHAPPALDFARLNCWPWRERCEVTWVDWRQSDLGRRVDLIVGADIVYDRNDVPYLDKFWQRHLAIGGTIMLADPARLMTLDLMPLISAAGWTVRRDSLPATAISKPVNVFYLTRA
jgi:predicted nicotinamide N-methyase